MYTYAQCLLEHVDQVSTQEYRNSEEFRALSAGMRNVIKHGQGIGRVQKGRAGVQHRRHGAKIRALATVDLLPRRALRRAGAGGTIRSVRIFPLPFSTSTPFSTQYTVLLPFMYTHSRAHKHKHSIAPLIWIDFRRVNKANNLTARPPSE